MQSTDFLLPLLIYFLPIACIAESFYATPQVFSVCLYGHLFPTPHPTVISVNECGTTYQRKSASYNLKGRLNSKNWLTVLLKEQHSQTHRCRTARDLSDFPVPLPFYCHSGQTVDASQSVAKRLNF